MDLPRVPTERHIVRGAALGLTAGTVLARFTGSGASTDLGVIVGVSHAPFRAGIRGTLRATNEGDG